MILDPEIEDRLNEIALEEEVPFEELVLDYQEGLAVVTKGELEEDY